MLAYGQNGEALRPEQGYPMHRLLEFLVSELGDVMPDATWAAAGIGRHQLEVNHWCLELGGHPAITDSGVVAKESL